MTTLVRAPCVILTNFRYLVYREAQSVFLWFLSHIHVLMVLLYCSVRWGHTLSKPSCIVRTCHLSMLLLMETWITLSTVNTALKISAWDPVDSVVSCCRLNWWFYFKHLKSLHPVLYRGRAVYSPQHVQGSTLCRFYQHSILFCLIVVLTMMYRRYLPEVLLCMSRMFSGAEYLYNASWTCVCHFWRNGH